MGSKEYEDSTGKNRLDSHSRSTALIFAMVVGLCLGVMSSERVYVHYQVSPKPYRMTATSCECGARGY